MLLWCRKPCLRRSRGFLLFEAVLAAFILAAAACTVIPLFQDRAEERELDLGTQEIASAIRTAQVIARNGKSKDGISYAQTHFTCRNRSDGRVEYWTTLGNLRTGPRGLLPPSLTAYSEGLRLTFDKNGFAGKSRQYSMEIGTKDGRYKRSITVAMYTGRVRIS